MIVAGVLVVLCNVTDNKIIKRCAKHDHRPAGTVAHFDAEWIELFTEGNAAVLARTMSGTLALVGYLKAHLNRLNEGDYFALLAYTVPYVRPTEFSDEPA